MNGNLISVELAVNATRTPHGPGEQPAFSLSRAGQLEYHDCTTPILQTKTEQLYRFRFQTQDIQPTVHRSDEKTDRGEPMLSTLWQSVGKSRIMNSVTLPSHPRRGNSNAAQNSRPATDATSRLRDRSVCSQGVRAVGESCQIRWQSRSSQEQAPRLCRKRP